MTAKPILAADTLMDSYTGSRANSMGLPDAIVAGWLRREGRL